MTDAFRTPHLRLDRLWLFDLVLDELGRERAQVSAIALASAMRRSAARAVLEKELRKSGINAHITYRGTLATHISDEAFSLAYELPPNSARIGSLGFDHPSALATEPGFQGPFGVRTIETVDDVFAPCDAVTLGVPDHVYAVLDAAKVFGLPELLETSGLAYRSLFKGKAAQEYADTAPYVVRLLREHSLTRRLLRATDPEDPLGWTAGPGLFVQTPLSLTGLQIALRKFTMLPDAAQNRRLYFRFYDPVVFRTVMVNAQPEFTERFMRGLRHVVFASADGTPQMFTRTSEG